MITFSGILEVLTAFLKFPDGVVSLVRVLSKTPEEKHADLIAKVQATFDEGSSNDRPIW